jgi:hypothetical protein
MKAHLKLFNAFMAWCLLHNQQGIDTGRTQPNVQNSVIIIIDFVSRHLRDIGRRYRTKI